MKNFLEKLKTKFKKQDTATMASSLNPHKHWKLILKVFFIVVVLLIIISIYLLYRIKNDKIFQIDPIKNDSTNLLKEDLLKKVSEIFDNKAKKENELKTNPPIYSDPSV